MADEPTVGWPVAMLLADKKCACTTEDAPRVGIPAEMGAALNVSFSDIVIDGRLGWPAAMPMLTSA
jgi:hypothetical protein